jgi:hypothetical protein
MVMLRLSARWIFLVVSLCAAYALLGGDSQEALITFRAGDCREFIVDADGSVVLFAGDVNRWQAGKWSQSSIMIPEGVVYDAVFAPDGKWFIVSQRSQQEAILYKVDGSRMERVAAAPGRFQDGMTLHLAPDGTVWIAAKGPILYGVKDGKTITHELLPGVSPQLNLSFFPPTISLAMPGRGLWFWSQGDYRANRATESIAMKGFQVYDNGQWRAVPHSGGLLGGAASIDSDTILCATRYKGIFSLSTADGSVKDVEWTLPDKDSCVFLHSTPSGHVLAITAEPMMSWQLKRNDAGAFGKLVVFVNGRARVLLDGMDWGESRFDKGRPVVDTPQGTFIATVGGGVVFVPSDASQARRLDWRFNVPTSNVDRMRVQGILLYLLDRTKGLAVVDWEKLLSQPESPEKDRWSIYRASAVPAAADDGAIWWLEANRAAGQLSCWRNGKLTHISLEGSMISAAAVESVAADTKGGIWLIPQQTAQAAACFNYGKWRTFGGCDAAWRTVALEEKGNSKFRLAGGSLSRPVFGNGRVAYLDSLRRIHYFDGVAWMTIASYPSNDRTYGDESLSFVNGVLTARFRSGDYQFIEGQWKPRSGAVQPYSTEFPPGGRGVSAALPNSLPGDKSRLTISLRDTVDTSWMGNPEELYRGIEDLWIRFPTAGTPLFAAEHLSNVLVDGLGDLWFVLQNGASTQLAHYVSRGKAPTLEWARPPASAIGTAQAIFLCRVRGMEGRGQLRYRSDGGIWRQIPLAFPEQEIALKSLSNGIHSIEARAYDELLRSSQSLIFVFEVKRDYEAEIRDLVSLLRSSDFNQRETVARALVSIGRPAVPALTALKEKAESDLRWWIQAILEEIDRNAKSKN